jgi:hypothetical protein
MTVQKLPIFHSVALSIGYQLCQDYNIASRMEIKSRYEPWRYTLILGAIRLVHSNRTQVDPRTSTLTSLIVRFVDTRLNTKRDSTSRSGLNGKTVGLTLRVSRVKAVVTLFCCVSQSGHNEQDSYIFTRSNCSNRSSKSRCYSIVAYNH